MIDENLILEDIPKTTMLQCGVTDSIGNIVGVCVEYFKSLFPVNFFQSEYINTQYVIKDFRNIKTSMADLKKPRPILIVNVKLDLSSEPNFLDQSDHFKNNIYPMFNPYKNPNLSILFHDKESHIRISYGLREMKISLEFQILFETQIQQINTQAFLMQKQRHNDRPFFLDRYIEPKIPYALLHQLARHKEMDVSNDNYVGLLEYVNRFSRPISYRVQTSTGNKEFFFKGKSPLLVVFESNPEADDGQRKDMTDGFYTLRDTMSVRFSVPTMYLYESYLRAFDLSRYITFDIKDAILGNDSFIPAYTLQFVQNPQVDRDDLVLITQAKFCIDEEKEEDVIDLTNIFTKPTIEFIQHNIRKGIDNRTMFSFYLRKQEFEIRYSKEYDIDYNNLTLTLIKPQLNATYSVLVYANRKEINSFIQGLENPEGNIIY